MPEEDISILLATAGGGCRFRASSTVTSSSGPCNLTLGHSAAHALERQENDGMARSAGSCASLAACGPVGVYP